MKIQSLFAIGVILFMTLSSAAQGTLSYEVTADSAHAIPPHSSTRVATGTFTLDSSLLFNGKVFMEDYLDVTSVTFFRSTSPSQVGTMLYDLTPGGIANPGPNGEPGGRLFDFNQTLSSTEAADIEAGLWWVSVITPTFPNGEIRGQITVVPEPSTWALIGFGAVAVAVARKRNRA